MLHQIASLNPGDLSSIDDELIACELVGEANDICDCAGRLWSIRIDSTKRAFPKLLVERPHGARRNDVRVARVGTRRADVRFARAGNDIVFSDDLRVFVVGSDLIPQPLPVDDFGDRIGIALGLAVVAGAVYVSI